MGPEGTMGGAFDWAETSGSGGVPEHHHADDRMLALVVLLASSVTRIEPATTLASNTSKSRDSFQSSYPKPLS
ncbi:MAG: hypothetical protein ACI9F9_001155 [Candidatus Paceibacteria bacterium]|jgi:hypothetical protein